MVSLTARSSLRLCTCANTSTRDQELRFTVYESLDYTKLKVSVFNEDKRTDLIGETFIDLAAVLLRGGGQADAWHDLNSKGRYAGQIRIELTFYDRRPKDENSRGTSGQRQSSLSRGTVERQEIQPPGPRDPQSVKRRPLPAPDASTPPRASDNGESMPIPVPQSTPRSYHTPPRQHQAEEEYRNEVYAEQYSQLQSSLAHSEDSTLWSTLPHSHSASGIPSSNHPSMSEPHGDFSYHDSRNSYSTPMERYRQEPEDYNDGSIPYSDDPYALQAVLAVEERRDVPELPTVAPLRHDRVQQLSGTPPGRSLPSTIAQAAYHPHSEPTYHNEQPHTDPRFNYGYHGDQGEPSNSPNSYLQLHSASEPHVPTRATYGHHDETSGHPPAPPSHRNSVPVPARPAPQSNSSQLGSPEYSQDPMTSARPAYSSSSIPSSHHVESQHQPYQVPAPDRRYSADQPHVHQQSPNYRHSYSSSSPPASQYQQQSPYSRDGPIPNAPLRQSPQASYPHSAVSIESSHQRSPLSHGMSAPSTQQTPTIIRPRPISPNEIRVTPSPPGSQVPRKALSSQSIPPGAAASSAVPFSPDSFDNYNPQVHQSQRTQSSPFDTQEPSPMYMAQSTREGAFQTTSSHTSPAVSQQNNTAKAARSLSPNRPQPQPHQQGSSEQSDASGPIIGSDGRVIDPSDHLPAHTHAPEPERKGADRNRPAISVNVKHRFGPREARGPPASGSSTIPEGLRSQSEPVAIPNAVGQMPPVVHAQSATPYARTPPSAKGQGYGSASTGTPPSASSGRNRLQKRGSPSAPANTTPSPLGPSHPGALNTSYTLPQAPPAVPGKVPISPEHYSAPNHMAAPHPYQAPVEQPPPPPRMGDGAMTVLRNEMARIDLGPCGGGAGNSSEAEKKYGGGHGGRLRRSRFGA